MSINWVISEICCNLNELICKQLQTKIAMITENKVTEIFCMADDFCKFFDAMTTKYTLKPTGKRKYHRNSTMSKAEVMLIMGTVLKKCVSPYFLIFVYAKKNNKKMKLTHSQISEIISDYTSSSEGFVTLQSLIMNSLMNHERKLFVKEHEGEQCNGFRSRRWYTVMVLSFLFVFHAVAVAISILFF